MWAVVVIADWWAGEAFQASARESSHSPFAHHLLTWWCQNGDDDGVDDDDDVDGDDDGSEHDDDADAILWELSLYDLLGTPPSCTTHSLIEL